ncbi:helix-turn-helix domain-containing protein [Streptomyces atratus]|uniref:helix-turn-helix domain-containing protein n=1 Tax=Streptomyces atratus TaxID=1893 RepID=UPI00338FE577
MPRTSSRIRGSTRYRARWTAWKVAHGRGPGARSVQLNDAEQLTAFADRTLAGVRHHDLRRGTHLLHALRVHANSKLSKSETAQRLNVHPNTVSQHLRRIEVCWRASTCPLPKPSWKWGKWVRL